MYVQGKKGKLGFPVRALGGPFRKPKDTLREVNPWSNQQQRDEEKLRLYFA